jgi:hypothetical protein
MPRQARTASPINPRIAPTAINTVPSGTFVVCIYGAFAVGGTVTTGPDVEVEDEDVESVVVETDDVVLEVEEVEEVDDEDVVDVVDMVVDVVDEEEVVLEVDFVVDVDEEEDEVLVTLEVVEVGSAVVVWAASVVVEVDFASAGSAATRAVMASSSTKRKMNDGWAFPSPRRESLILFWFPRSLCQYVKESDVLHSGSAGVVGNQ